MSDSSTKTADNAFATIIIILPSKFTCGAARLSLSGLSATYDCSEESFYQTTVLAWHTDVKHELKPITSGYRLALAYNLMHSPSCPRPVLSTNTDGIQELRDILKSWKNATATSGPEKIVFLLDHKYPPTDLRASTLKGADAHKFATVDMLAQEFDMHAGLGNAVYSFSGRPTKPGYGGDYYDRGLGALDAYGEPVDEDDLEIVDATEGTLEIKSFVDADGKSVSAVPVPVRSQDEVIPANLPYAMRRGDPDGQEYYSEDSEAGAPTQLSRCE